MEEQIPAPVAVPEIPKTVASVGVPAVPSAADLAKVAADTGGGATGIVMALIAVLGGGGAIWKYLQTRNKSQEKRDEQAHEARMKEIELQSQRQQRDEDNHGECKASQASAASRLAALEAKVAEVSNKSLDLSAGGGVSEEVEESLKTLSKRITKLETAAKTKKAK